MDEIISPADEKYDNLDRLFCDWFREQGEDEPSEFGPRKMMVAKFLGDMMFKSKQIQVVTDPKERIQLCDNLTRYIYSICAPEDDLLWVEDEYIEGDDDDDDED